MKIIKTLTGWGLGARVAKFVAYGVPLLLLGALVLSLTMCGDDGAKVESKLNKRQGEAALNSGSDAVDTVANRQEAEAEGSRTVEETKDEVNRAENATAASAAGRSGLCRLAGNRGKPECMQRTAP